MKISKEERCAYGGLGTIWLQTWREIAARIGSETGVFINVKYELDEQYIIRIYYSVMEHEFESETELRRALALKAFL
jgi:hypothetical protein